MKYLDTWRDMHRSLPPYPKRRESSPENRQRVIGEVLDKLRTIRERLEEADRIAPFGLAELKEKVRIENELYLQEKERENVRNGISNRG